MTSDLQLVQLRALVTVARLSSYAQAAEELSYTEPAVILQIRGLEKSLGLNLVRRERKQVKLTAAGEQIVGAAADVLDRANQLEQTARGLRGRIVIASGPNTAVSLLMPLIAQYQVEFPTHTVELHADDVEGLINGILEGAFDIAVGGIPRDLLTSPRLANQKLVLAPWANDEWWLFARGPVGRNDAGPVFDVRRLGVPIRVFFYRGSLSWIGDLTPFLEAQLGRQVEVVVQDTMELVRGAVINGVGLGILPLSVMHVTAANQVLPLLSLGEHRKLTLRLLHRRSRLLTPRVQNFLRFLIGHRRTVTAESEAPLDRVRPG
jgi:DNA-binding transcriptional LysR family regulator